MALLDTVETAFPVDADPVAVLTTVFGIESVAAVAEVGAAAVVALEAEAAASGGAITDRAASRIARDMVRHVTVSARRAMPRPLRPRSAHGVRIRRAPRARRAHRRAVRLSAVSANERPIAELDITVFVSAKDVMRALGCGRSSAYDHLRRAGGVSREGEMLRISLEQWERYATLRFGGEGDAGCTSDNAARSGTGPSTTSTGTVTSDRRAAPTKRQLGPFSRPGSAKPLIPIVQPRRRPSTMP